MRPHFLSVPESELDVIRAVLGVREYVAFLRRWYDLERVKPFTTCPRDTSLAIMLRVTPVAVAVPIPLLVAYPSGWQLGSTFWPDARRAPAPLIPREALTSESAILYLEPLP
jgi:hypothetical protein